MDARGDLARRGEGALRGGGRAVQGRARRHRRGRHLAVHAGRLHRPLPRPAPAELEADQGGQAHRPRRRVLARRLDEAAADPDLRHGVLLAEGSRRATSSGSRRRRSATTASLGAQLDLFHLSEHSPGSPFWHPKGMVIWNELEDLRRRENLARGYVEVKTPLLYDVETYITSGHYENYRENMFFVASKEDENAVRAEADELPRAHAPLRLARSARYRDLPFRYAESSTLHRDELGGHAARPAARAAHHPGRRPHLLHAATRSRTRSSAASTSPPSSTTSSGWRRAFELSTRPEKKRRHRRGVGLHRGRAPVGARAARDRLRASTRATARSTARRSTCT